MRRRILTAGALVGALGLIAPRHAPSVEDVFVATTEAAAETAESVCLMPDGLDAADAGGQIAIPRSSNTEGGDLPPVRMVVDPYPSFNGVAVDPAGDLLLMSDTNRKSLLVYNRTAGSATSRQQTPSKQQIMGPDTGVGFAAGVAIDPVHRELFTVNNDVEDRLVVFDYDAGNVTPKRLLYVPHQSWGIGFAPKRYEIALSVQTPNMFVVFRRDARKFDAPVHGARSAHPDGGPARDLLRRDAQRDRRREPRELPAQRADHVGHGLRRP